MIGFQCGFVVTTFGVLIEVSSKADDEAVPALPEAAVSSEADNYDDIKIKLEMDEGILLNIIVWFSGSNESI